MTTPGRLLDEVAALQAERLAGRLEGVRLEVAALCGDEAAEQALATTTPTTIFADEAARLLGVSAVSLQSYAARAKLDHGENALGLVRLFRAWLDERSAKDEELLATTVRVLHRLEPLAAIAAAAIVLRWVYERQRSMTPEVAPLLDEVDRFVRSAAADALAAVKNAAKALPVAENGRWFPDDAKASHALCRAVVDTQDVASLIAVLASAHYIFKYYVPSPSPSDVRLETGLYFVACDGLLTWIFGRPKRAKRPEVPREARYRVVTTTRGHGGDVFVPYDGEITTFFVMDCSSETAVCSFSGESGELDVTIAKDGSQVLVRDLIGLRSYPLPESDQVEEPFVPAATWLEVFDIAALYDAAPRTAQSFLLGHPPLLPALPLTVGKLRIDDWSALAAAVAFILREGQPEDAQSLYLRLLGTSLVSEVGRLISQYVAHEDEALRAFALAFYRKFPCAAGFEAVVALAESDAKSSEVRRYAISRYSDKEAALDLMVARLEKRQKDSRDALDEQAAKLIRESLIRRWFSWPERQAEREKTVDVSARMRQRRQAIRALVWHDADWLAKNVPAIERASAGRWEAVLSVLAEAAQESLALAAARALFWAQLLDPQTLRFWLETRSYRSDRLWAHRLTRLLHDTPSPLLEFLSAAASFEAASAFISASAYPNVNGHHSLRLYRRAADRIELALEVRIGMSDFAFAATRIDKLGFPLGSHDCAVWLAQDKSFAVFFLDKLTVEVQRGWFRFADGSPRVARSQVIAVEPFLSADWVFRGVRLVLKDAKTRDVVSEEDRAPEADPTYDFSNLLFDMSWTSSFGRALAAWLEVPFRARSWNTTPTSI